MKNVKRVTGDCQVLWHAPVVPAAQEAEAGDCLSPRGWRSAWPEKKSDRSSALLGSWEGGPLCGGSIWPESSRKECSPGKESTDSRILRQKGLDVCGKQETCVAWLLQ